MPKLFISYRRADSRKDAGRIYDRMAEAFGKENVFKDVDSIPMGKDFRGVLREAVAACDMQIVIIGKSWLTVTDENGRPRLADADDFVHIEVESALQRDDCLVIPVLVDNAPMPHADDLPLDLRELAFKNAAVVRDDPDFHADVTRIIASLLGQPPPKPPIAAAFDVHDAIGRFYQAYDAKDWDGARALLAEIRVSGTAPRVFDLDAHEAQIWAGIEAEERSKDYQILRLMADRTDSSEVWKALQVFWQTFPGYDPDNLARFKPAAVEQDLPETADTGASTAPVPGEAAPRPEQIRWPGIFGSEKWAAQWRAWVLRFVWAFMGALAASGIAVAGSASDARAEYFAKTAPIAALFALCVLVSDQPWQDRRGRWSPRHRAWVAGLIGFGSGTLMWAIIASFQYWAVNSSSLLDSSYGGDALIACTLAGIGFGLSYGLMNRFLMPGWLSLLVVFAGLMWPGFLASALFGGSPVATLLFGPGTTVTDGGLALFMMALGVNAQAIWRDVRGLRKRRG